MRAVLTAIIFCEHPHLACGLQTNPSCTNSQKLKNDIFHKNFLNFLRRLRLNLDNCLIISDTNLQHYMEMKYEQENRNR